MDDRLMSVTTSSARQRMNLARDGGFQATNNTEAEPDALDEYKKHGSVDRAAKLKARECRQWVEMKEPSDVLDLSKDELV
jgi:hypothetical protein